MTPTPGRTHAHRAATLRGLEVIAIPMTPVAGQRATIENV
jgi:hypothetical protein